MMAAKFLAVVMVGAMAVIPITMRILVKKGLGKEAKKDDKKVES